MVSKAIRDLEARGKVTVQYGEAKALMQKIFN